MPRGRYVFPPLHIAPLIDLPNGVLFPAPVTMSACFTRLLSHQTPPAKKVAAQLIPVGALANAAYSFDTLSYLAGPKKHIFEYYAKGSVADPGFGKLRRAMTFGALMFVSLPGQGIYAAGLLIGLTIYGFATSAFSNRS